MIRAFLLTPGVAPALALATLAGFLAGGAGGLHIGLRMERAETARARLECTTAQLAAQRAAAEQLRQVQGAYHDEAQRHERERRQLDRRLNELRHTAHALQYPAPQPATATTATPDAAATPAPPRPDPECFDAERLRLDRAAAAHVNAAVARSLEPDATLPAGADHAR